MTRASITIALKEYFASKGRMYTYDEYKEAEDAPIRLQVIKRAVGSWARVTNLVGEVAPLPQVVEVKVDAKKLSK